MNQKTALILSAGITSFMLMVGGGAAVMANQVSASLNSTVQPVVTYANGVTTVSHGEMTSQREAQYIQLVNQANSQIKQANAEITLLKEQLKQAQAPTVSQTAANTITSLQAQTIALNAVQGAIVLRIPDLVNFQGAPTYEVVLDKGTLYIDAKTGAILQNGAASTGTGQSQNGHESGGDD